MVLVVSHECTRYVDFVKKGVVNDIHDMRKYAFATVAGQRTVVTSQHANIGSHCNLDGASALAKRRPKMHDLLCIGLAITVTVRSAYTLLAAFITRLYQRKCYLLRSQLYNGSLLLRALALCLLLYTCNAEVE